MARQFLTAIDLAKNELQNAAIHNLPSAPSSPVKGQLYMDTTTNILYFWDGTAWISTKAAAAFPGYGAVPAETTFGIAKNDGVATTVSRSDHTHGSPAHNAAEHSTIPISALAAATGPVNLNGFKIIGLATPTADTDAANKGYVDNLVNGLSWKDAVRAATTANITLSAPQTIDGVSVIAGDRVLVKNQTTTSENGIYVVGAGAWTRATDFDAAGEADAAATYVMQGTTLADTVWTVTTDPPITIGTTGLTWAQIAGPGSVTAGAGMTQSGNTLNVIGDASIVVTADLVTRGALTGDVTAAQSSNATTIANDAVTNAKAANMPANTIKGNNTGASADPLDLTTAQVKTMLGITVADVTGAVRKFAADCAAAASTVVNHAFNTRDVIVNVYRTTTPWDTVETDIERTDANNVTVRFSVAPAAGAFRIVVEG